KQFTYSIFESRFLSTPTSSPPTSTLSLHDALPISSVQALSRPGRGRHVEHRRPGGGRHLTHRRVFRGPERIGPDQGGPRARGAQCVRERISPGVREGGVGLSCAERIGGSLMSDRKSVV